MSPGVALRKPRQSTNWAMVEATTHHVIRRRQPLRTILLVAVVTAFLAWGSWGLYDFGRQRAGYDADETQRQINILELRLRERNGENMELREKIAVFERSTVVDEKAYTAVEDSLRLLQDELAELKQQVSFYQGIVSPADASLGVQVQNLKLERLSEGNDFHFKLILIQGPARARRVTGTVTFIVAGVQDGEQKSLSLKELSGGEMTSLKYRFKYFQNFQGDFILPDTFEPMRVTVRVTPQGAKAKDVEKVFQWSNVAT